MLRVGVEPGETLRRHSGTIYRAACEGDDDFFHKVGLALRSRNRKKSDTGSTGYALLTHWFSGLLWLMNDEAGHRALRFYTGNRIDIGAYRQMLRRLRLRNHPGRAKPLPSSRIIQRPDATNTPRSGHAWSQLCPPDPR